MRISTLIAVMLLPTLLSGCYVYPPYPDPYAYPNGTYPSGDGPYPQQTYQYPAPVDESYCREYTHKVQIDGEGQSQKMHGTACRQPDGSWVAID